MILDRYNIGDITVYLQLHHLLQRGEAVLKVEKPGEGNMNYVVRACLPARNLIIKQARPYVEKYPGIAAPEERIITEGEFYKQAAKDEVLRAAMPTLILVDEENHILILEDLGEARDLTYLYQQNKQLTTGEAKALTSFLSTLHNNCKATEANELMANRKLRALNHEHIFIYPLMTENGFDLDTVQPGLQQLAMRYKTNDLLKAKAATLGKIYLQDGNTLLHGDYYPGSWLQTATGVKVIDPEFCFYGFAEFDLGVMLAHLLMARQEDEVIAAVHSAYKKPVNFDDELLDKFTGIEIIRRIIGLAQLPLTLTLEEKEELLEKAVGLLG